MAFLVRAAIALAQRDSIAGMYEMGWACLATVVCCFSFVGDIAIYRSKIRQLEGDSDERENC